MPRVIKATRTQRQKVTRNGPYSATVTYEAVLIVSYDLGGSTVGEFETTENVWDFIKALAPELRITVEE